MISVYLHVKIITKIKNMTNTACPSIIRLNKYLIDTPMQQLIKDILDIDVDENLEDMHTTIDLTIYSKEDILTFARDIINNIQKVRALGYNNGPYCVQEENDAWAILNGTKSNSISIYTIRLKQHLNKNNIIVQNNL